MKKYHIINLHQDCRGETLLELVCSIGLFAITMLMVAAMFGAANTTLQKNYQTDKKLDLEISDIVKKENIANTKDVSVTFVFPDGKTKDITVEELKTQRLHRYGNKN